MREMKVKKSPKTEAGHFFEGVREKKIEIALTDRQTDKGCNMKRRKLMVLEHGGVTAGWFRPPT